MVTGGTIGIDATDTGAGAITVEVDDVTAGQGIVTNAGTGETVISLVATADVVGSTGNGINAQSTGGTQSRSRVSAGLFRAAISRAAPSGIYSRTQGGDILVDNLDTVTGPGRPGH